MQSVHIQPKLVYMVLPDEDHVGRCVAILCEDNLSLFFWLVVTVQKSAQGLDE